jgi:membrane protein required for colicin V production
MVWVDLAIVGIILLSALVGLARGLLREVLSFAIWLGALFLAWTVHKELAAELARWIENPTARLGAAFLILVFAVLVLGAIFGHLLSALVDKTGLTGTDRVLGVVFGAARGGVLVAMLVFLAALTPLPEDDWWQDSALIGRFQSLAELILEQIPPEATDRLKAL